MFLISNVGAPTLKLLNGVSVTPPVSNLRLFRQVSRCNQQHHTVWRNSHLGSERHSFPRAMAAFFCRAVLLGSAAARRSSISTISVPSRRLAVPSNSRQWARHSAAFPDTVSSQLEASKRRNTDSSVQTEHK